MERNSYYHTFRLSAGLEPTEENAEEEGAPELASAEGTMEKPTGSEPILAEPPMVEPNMAAESTAAQATTSEGQPADATAAKDAAPEDVQQQPKLEPPPPEKPVKKKLTKAEKRALKLEKKEKKRLKALETKRNQIRDQLQRELKYGHLNYLRAYSSWQQMCKGIKLHQLQEELATLWQYVNQILDQKNFKITLLQEQLEELGQMNKRCISKHVEILDFVINFYEYALTLIKENYEKVAEILILSFFAETDEIAVIQDKRKTFTENFVHLTNIALKYSLDKLKINYEVELRDEVDTNIEQRYLLRDETAKKMTAMHNQLIQIVASLQHDAVDPKRKAEYNLLVDKNLATQNELAKMDEATKKGQYVIVDLQKKLVKYENKFNSKLSGLRNEKTFYVEHYWRLREQYRQLTYDADQALSVLAMATYSAVQELEKQVRYGELLLGLAQCCRKSQTEKEKVLPWPDKKQLDEMMQALEDADKKTAEMLIMQLFWYRVCRVKSHVLYLKKEKEDMALENSKYCQKLKSCYEVETADQVIISLMLNPPVSSVYIPDICPKCNLEFPN